MSVFKVYTKQQYDHSALFKSVQRLRNPGEVDPEKLAQAKREENKRQKHAIKFKEYYEDVDNFPVEEAVDAAVDDQQAVTIAAAVARASITTNRASTLLPVFAQSLPTASRSMVAIDEDLSPIKQATIAPISPISAVSPARVLAPSRKQSIASVQDPVAISSPAALDSPGARQRAKKIKRKAKRVADARARNAAAANTVSISLTAVLDEPVDVAPDVYDNPDEDLVATVIVDAVAALHIGEETGKVAAAPAIVSMPRARGKKAAAKANKENAQGLGTEIESTVPAAASAAPEIAAAKVRDEPRAQPKDLLSAKPSKSAQRRMRTKARLAWEAAHKADAAEVTDTDVAGYQVYVDISAVASPSVTRALALPAAQELEKIKVDCDQAVDVVAKQVAELTLDTQERKAGSAGGKRGQKVASARTAVSQEIIAEPEAAAPKLSKKKAAAAAKQQAEAERQRAEEERTAKEHREEAEAELARKEKETEEKRAKIEEEKQRKLEAKRLKAEEKKKVAEEKRCLQEEAKRVEREVAAKAEEEERERVAAELKLKAEEEKRAKIEEEKERKLEAKRVKAEEKRKAMEEKRCMQEAEEAERKRVEAEEAERKRVEAERAAAELKQKLEEEKERKLEAKRVKEEKKKKMAEEAEEERLRAEVAKAEEEAECKRQKEAERLAKIEEERERKFEAKRIKAEEKKKKAEEEKRRQEEEAGRKREEERLAQLEEKRRQQEEVKRIKAEEKKKADEEKRRRQEEKEELARQLRAAEEKEHAECEKLAVAKAKAEEERRKQKATAKRSAKAAPAFAVYDESTRPVVPVSAYKPKAKASAKAAQQRKQVSEEVASDTSILELAKELARPASSNYSVAGNSSSSNNNDLSLLEFARQLAPHDEGMTETIDLRRNTSHGNADSSGSGADTMELARLLAAQPRDSVAHRRDSVVANASAVKAASKKQATHKKAGAELAESDQDTVNFARMLLDNNVNNRQSSDAVNVSMLSAPVAVPKANKAAMRDSSADTMDLARVLAAQRLAAESVDEAQASDEADGDDSEEKEEEEEKEAEAEKALGAENDLNAMDLAKMLAAGTPKTGAVRPRVAFGNRTNQPRESADTMDLARLLSRASVAQAPRMAYDQEDDGLNTMDLAKMLAIRSGPSIAEILNQPAPTPDIMRKPPHYC